MSPHSCFSFASCFFLMFHYFSGEQNLKFSMEYICAFYLQLIISFLLQFSFVSKTHTRLTNIMGFYLEIYTSADDWNVQAIPNGPAHTFRSYWAEPGSDNASWEWFLWFCIHFMHFANSLNTWQKNVLFIFSCQFIMNSILWRKLDKRYASRSSSVQLIQFMHQPTRKEY